jgi:transcriptional regulator with XRE-family HTH domain
MGAGKFQKSFRIGNTAARQNDFEPVSGLERKFTMGKAVSYAQWSLEPYCIGTKLRSLRTQKRLTLARLAEETGLSTALLSKLETDRMVPTLPTLATISRAYGVGMSYFFNEPARHTLSITRKAHLEGYERGMEQARIMPLNAAGESAPLTAPSAGAGRKESRLATAAAESNHRGPRLAAQLIEFPAGGAAATSDCFHATTGLVYVLEGRLQLDSGGLHELLETGDCAYMESDMALAWSAAGKSRCRVLAVLPGNTEQ